MLQLHKLPKCLVLKCWEEWVLSKMKQGKPGRLIKLHYGNEMNSVAGDAVENQRRSLLTEATTQLKRHQRQNHDHLQEYQQGVRRHLSDVQQ